MVLEEADRVRGGELERAAGRSRPERRGERHEEVPAEALRVAVVVEVLAERLRIVLGPRGAEPAADLPQQRDEPGPGGVRGLGERPPARVLESAVGAADGERHVRLVGLHVQLAEEPREERVVPLVVDEEARVERKPVVDDRVRVTSGAPVAFEHRDLVRPREQVGRTEAGDAAADDCDPHQPLFAPRRMTDDCEPSSFADSRT